MQTITFVTGNPDKIAAATRICGEYDIAVEPVSLDIPEIQSEIGAEIARDKAQKAFDILQKPLIVNDDTWLIPGLGGFPGPYMKSINHWFSADDFLRLTSTLTDRRVILRQEVVFQDSHGQQTFSHDIEGRLLDEIRGESHNPNDVIISLRPDGLSMAEARALGEPTVNTNQTVWHVLRDWARKYQT